MFSVIFPGQGSQLVGMGKDLHDKYSLIQDLFKEADDTLGFSLSKFYYGFKCCNSIIIIVYPHFLLKNNYEFIRTHNSC